jgi:NADH-quinone oxidoreductase subunit M
MLLILLLIVPLLTGLISFAIKDQKTVKAFSILGAVAVLIIAALTFCGIKDANALKVDYAWLPGLGANFSLEANAGTLLLTLLTAIVYPLVYLSQWNKDIANSNRFFGLMGLSASGLMGVFLANDLLLFYFFWELALIPVYFLAGQWGGKDRIKASLKFFVYTFLGSLLMLAGLIYLYISTPDYSFAYGSIATTGAGLPFGVQGALFLLFFIAFGIKMPIFPLHSWQAQAYEQSFTPVTIVMSALMVKMGLYAVVKWLIPIFPNVDKQFYSVIMVLALIGIIYGSLLAIAQKDIKRLIAYSSLAHVGLMIMGAFSMNKYGSQGLYLQMFNHGIIITGLWLLVDFIESRYKTRNLKELGGMAYNAPKAAIVLVIVTFASIALPLTNGFVGEFLLFMGVFHSAFECKFWYMAIAGLGIILGAIYMLNMVQNVAYGSKKEMEVKDLTWNETAALYAVVVMIIVLGVYPNMILNLL